MASDSSGIFGFELLQKSVSVDISKKEDVLVLLTHWHFLKNGFRCLGLGDSKVITDSEKGSELLPDGWNSNPNYTLRYVQNGKLYIFVGVKSELDMLFNLLRVEDHKVSNVQIPISSVTEINGPLGTIVPTYQEILNSISQDLLEPVFSAQAREIETQTTPSSDDQDRSMPFHQMRVRPVTFVPLVLPTESEPLHPWRNVGQNDLNPFAPAGPRGGGMLFDPFEQNLRRPAPTMPGLGVPGRLPPGAIPPGARFDPFGPPDLVGPVPRRGDPDNDHFPPPGHDHMFM